MLSDRRRQHSDRSTLIKEIESGFADGETNKTFWQFWIIEPLGGSINRVHAAQCAARSPSKIEVLYDSPVPAYHALVPL